MLNGCQLESHQIGKPYYICPCYIPTSYLALGFVHVVNHQPTFTEKLTIFHLLSFSSSISISIPSSSSFCSIIALCVSFLNCESLFASSLLSPLFLPKINTLVDLPIFYTPRSTQKERKKRKCKGWNGKEGPTWRTPKFLDGLNCESKGEDSGRRKNWGVFPSSQQFGGRRAC